MVETMAAMNPSDESMVPAESGAADQVSNAEVVTAFVSYFAQRADANVMVGKAVTGVSFANGVVRVTFESAAAGVTEAAFDELKAFDNLARFAVTPVAFNDELGRRLRPLIDSIETVGPNGVSLGALSRVEILALNGLSG